MRWVQSCTAAKSLRQDFLQGAILPDSFDPKQVQSTRPEYMEYEPACFSRNLQKIAKDFIKASDAGTTFLEKWLEDGKPPSNSTGKYYNITKHNEMINLPSFFLAYKALL